MECPRCHEVQEEGPEECRACGVIFSRYRPGRPPAAVDLEADEAPVPWQIQLRDRMFRVEPSENRAAVVGRGVFLGILGLVTVGILTTPMRGPYLMDSFIHWIDLPFHEAGHVVFSPLGTFMHILGGTLGQLLVPFIALAAFLREENPFGAAVGGWWLGQSFVDCSPYIADAQARVLLLTTGETGQVDWESHDWYQLLSRTGLLSHDIFIARMAWVLGALLMAASLAWAAHVVRRQWGR